MKVLFLDIDGVLNSLEWAVDAGHGFGCPPGYRNKCRKERLRWCPDMVRRLRRIVETTGASIVISSSWRGYGRTGSAVRKWRAMFNVYGWRNAPVLGETPDLTVQAGLVVAAPKRGSEVAAWIAAHPHVVEHYVCVDDCDDFLPGQPLVQTSMRQGLTDADAEQCIRLLSASAEPK